MKKLLLQQGWAKKVSAWLNPTLCFDTFFAEDFFATRPAVESGISSAFRAASGKKREKYTCQINIKKEKGSIIETQLAIVTYGPRG